MSSSVWSRAFIALEITEEVRRRIERAQEILKEAGGDVGWVAVHNTHMSLAFLGDISPDTVAQISQMLDRVVPQVAGFDVEINGVGCFGREDSPRVLWAGVSGGRDEVLKLQEAVAVGLAGLGIELEDREFRPHITLGRVKSSRRRRELSDCAKQMASFSFGACRVGRVVLMRSVLKPAGPEYSVLHAAFVK